MKKILMKKIKDGSFLDLGLKSPILEVSEFFVFWALQVPPEIKDFFRKNITSFLGFALERSISRNIRNFFRVALFYFSISQNSLL